MTAPQRLQSSPTGRAEPTWRAEPTGRTVDEVEATMPRIVSVDDHVIEPPRLWLDRLPAKYHEVAPRVERRQVGNIAYAGTKDFDMTFVDEGGTPADIWFYEDLAKPIRRNIAAAGFTRDEMDLTPVTYEEMRPGCFAPAARLDDMDRNHVEASMCFPTVPRFCGQMFLEADDRDLALLCVRAYNDWMVEEWAAGSGGRLIPLCLVPLWDPLLAAAEVRRNAARGVRALSFCEIPAYLDLPTIHDADRHWDPLWDACQETGTVVCMHIGSSSRLPAPSPDAPAAVATSLTFNNAMASLCDFLFSGVLVRFPSLTLAYSEGQIGWLPYILERVDDVWERHRTWTGVRASIPEPPSNYYFRQVYGCFFLDRHGLGSLDEVGVDNVTFETDYPHTDGTWPDSRRVAAEMMAHLDDATIAKLVRGNAARMLQLDLD